MDQLESPSELGEELSLAFPHTPLQTTFGGELIPYDDDYVKLNSTLQVAWTESLGTDAFSNCTTYERTEVLMLSWEPRADDLKVQDEISRLTEVFEDNFNYHVTSRCLERNEKPTQVQVNKIVADWVYEYDSYKTLLIIYFAGHGRGSKEGGLEIYGNCSPSDVRDYLDKVVWNKTEQCLHGLRADVLQIFDCCFAGTIEMRGRRGASEFLAATDKDGYTPKPGASSFTTALIWALKELVEKKRRFTSSDLADKIRDAPDFPKEQKPLLVKRGGNSLAGRQLIVLQPLRDVAARSLAVETPSGETTHKENTGTDVMTLKFVFTTRPDESDIRKLGEDMGHIVARNDLKVNRIDFAGIQPKKSELVYQAITRFRRAVARRRSKGQTAAVAVDLIKNIEDDVEDHVLERIDDQANSQIERNRREFEAHTSRHRTRARARARARK